MLHNRRTESIPDQSYDLDGDGQVSGRDYVIARKFDKGYKKEWKISFKSVITINQAKKYCLKIEIF